MKFAYPILLLFLNSIFMQAVEQMPIQVIQGAVCCECVIRKDNNSVKAHLLIDLGQTSPITIHSDLVQLLDLDDAARLEIAFDGSVFKDLPYIAGDISELDELSRNNAQTLKEIPVWGILGAGAFDSDGIQLDLQNQILEYGSLEIPTGIELTLREEKSRYLYSIEPDPGYTVSGMFTTADYESVFDSDCAALAGSENADFENCMLASLNVRKYTALRVRDEYCTELTVADCMIGTGFWQNFVLTLDRRIPKLVLTPTDSGIISDLNEQIFFNALVNEDHAVIVDYIDNYPDSRLWHEACRYLLDAAIESNDPKQIEESVDRLIAGQESKQAAQILLIYAYQSIESKDMTTATLFLDRAKNQTLKTEDAPLLTGRINSYLGWIALNNRQYPQARRYLLSALLASPDDPFTNYLTGYLHQQQSELIRAWARYLKAALADEPFADAVSALKNLQQEPGFQNQFTVEDACDFLDGHIYADNGQLTDSAKMLKYRCGGMVQAAFDKLQEQAQ